MDRLATCLEQIGDHSEAAVLQRMARAAETLEERTVALSARADAAELSADWRGWTLTWRCGPGP